MLIAMDSAAEIGARIRERRTALGLSQSELGRMVGVEGQSVWRYEDGRQRPRPELFEALARALQCSERWLAYGNRAHDENDDRPADAVESFLAAESRVSEAHAAELRRLLRGPRITENMVAALWHAMIVRDMPRASYPARIVSPTAPERYRPRGFFVSDRYPLDAYACRVYISDMQSPLPCLPCAGLGRVVTYGEHSFAPPHGYRWCRRCAGDVPFGTPTTSACECTADCEHCSGSGLGECAACGGPSAGIHPAHRGDADEAIWAACQRCMDAWGTADGAADAAAERCSQWSAWVDGLESAPGAVSRRARRVAA